MPASRYEVLKEVVSGYPGLLEAATELVLTLDQPLKDWEAILGELRAYALKNFYLHDHHEQGAATVRRILDIFVEAVGCEDRKVRETAVDGLLFYLEKVLSDSGQDIGKYSAVLSQCFRELADLPEDRFLLVTVNPHQLKKLGRKIREKIPDDFDRESLNELLSRFFLTTLEYWLREDDPFVSYGRRACNAVDDRLQGEIEEAFYPVSHANLKGLTAYLEGLRKNEDLSPQDRLKELLTLPGFMEIAGFYQDLIGHLSRVAEKTGQPSLIMNYFYQLMNTEGLRSLHEDILREMARAVSAIVVADPQQARMVLPETFEVLTRNFDLCPDTVLYCIESMGNRIYSVGDSDLVEWFTGKVTNAGFQYARLKGLTDEWQVRSNKAHLLNIRTWLHLIEDNPKWSKHLISSLIINLKLGGVQISDTDLFQKDITQLLNSDVGPVYHFIKQLARVFPVFFSEINAEGELRDVSTELDETEGTADPLIHFLRKLCHVESSSLLVDLMEETIAFLLSGEKGPLERYLPENLYERLEASGPYVDGLRRIFRQLFSGGRVAGLENLLDLKGDETAALIAKVREVSDKDAKRARLLIRFYQLLHRKYRRGYQGLAAELGKAAGTGLPGAGEVIDALERGDVFRRLEAVLDYLERLKEIILSPERYEAVEDIMRKRHIAAGIPSMYGRYSEEKFNALSLTFRLENMANVFFEELTSTFDHRFITSASLNKTRKCLSLFLRALQLDGISSNRLRNMLELLSGGLRETSFSFSQYVDIFRGFSEGVQYILDTYYGGVHKNNLRATILRMGRGNVLPKYLGTGERQGDFEFVNGVSERFLREVIAEGFGLHQLDNFVGNTLRTLFRQAEDLDVQNLNLLLSYDPDKALSGIHCANSLTNDRIHLGNKAYNLVKLAAIGIKVPPGFVVTTEVSRCLSAIEGFGPSREHLDSGIAEQMRLLEEMTGKKFGDPVNPLLVSVRSGAAVSMPGMMNSFLNVGINEASVEGLIRQTGKAWFAWDCYRRFLQCWGMFFGMERDGFDSIMDIFKKKFDVGIKIQFTPEQMREVALAYREALVSAGVTVSDDPRVQLRTAVSLVFQSWNSRKAQTYREIMGISENWGTAVLVQAMVYGNLDFDSGTGVLFTRNPRGSSGKVMLWGDFSVGAQGEDVVSGLVKTLCISNEQRGMEERPSDISLEDSFPKTYDALLKTVKNLIYGEGWGAQEIEFTFEGEDAGDLYILQSRDMSVTRKESPAAFVPCPELSSCYLSSGIGVSGSALCGRAVFDLEDVEEYRRRDPSTPLILIRSDTVPDDITFISAADGILTARGGATSHASIIARKLGKTCVVGCNNLVVMEREKRLRIAGKTLAAGEFISIDGRNGSIYEGMHKIEEIRVLTE